MSIRRSTCCKTNVTSEATKWRTLLMHKQFAVLATQWHHWFAARHSQAHTFGCA